MPFSIAYADSAGDRDGATDTVLSPGPTTVVYPQDPAGKRIATTGGSIIVQQPINDGRIRSWIWSGYPGWYTPYITLWNTIEPLRSKHRLTDGDNTPYVYVMENETQMLRTISVASKTVTPTFPWIKVRVVEVSRQLRTGGSSLVVYAETKLSFVIEDPAYNDLG